MPKDPEIERIEGLAAAGAPAAAINVYGRWWQLETYLRQVVYTELRAASGIGWVEHLGGRTPSRAERDRINAYMASADANELLAYADARVLFELIDEQWELFESILPPKVRWDGAVDELLAIRNRSAHCRRPHRDDLLRLEQALRNLEPGAREFFRSYTDTTHLHPKGKDPLVRDWVGRRHPDADRLVEHCRDQYEVRFWLEHSVRPWAKAPEENAISGTRGVLWHAHWLPGPQEVRPAALWKELSEEVRALLVHMLFDGSSVTATFAAVDEEKRIAAAIGHVFDHLVMCSEPMELGTGKRSLEDRRARWLEGAEELAPKAQVETALARFDPYNPDLFSVFSA